MFNYRSMYCNAEHCRKGVCKCLISNRIIGKKNEKRGGLVELVMISGMIENFEETLLPSQLWFFYRVLASRYLSQLLGGYRKATRSSNMNYVMIGHVWEKAR